MNVQITWPADIRTCDREDCGKRSRNVYDVTIGSVTRKLCGEHAGSILTSVAQNLG